MLLYVFFRSATLPDRGHHLRSLGSTRPAPANLVTKCNELADGFVFEFLRFASEIGQKEFALGFCFLFWVAGKYMIHNFHKFPQVLQRGRSVWQVLLKPDPSCKVVVRKVSKTSTSLVSQYHWVSLSVLVRSAESQARGTENKSDWCRWTLSNIPWSRKQLFGSFLDSRRLEVKRSTQNGPRLKSNWQRQEICPTSQYHSKLSGSRWPYTFRLKRHPKSCRVSKYRKTWDRLVSICDNLQFVSHIYPFAQRSMYSSMPSVSVNSLPRGPHWRHCWQSSTSSIQTCNVLWAATVKHWVFSSDRTWRFHVHRQMLRHWFLFAWYDVECFGAAYFLNMFLKHKPI